jgi:cytochrome c-type protein NapC
MGFIKRFLGFLFSPSGKYSVATLAGGGLVLGVAAVVAFDYTMHATSTEEFCTSCHVMADNAGMMLVGTTHFSNESGVRPTCSDCHVPKEFGPKMIRKIQASREVWGYITGVIDTPEKYAAHAPVMKEREIARLKANDSRECRNCHDVNQMNFAQQSAKAQSYHKVLQSGKRTCIDCHAGLTHTPREQVSLVVPH